MKHEINDSKKSLISKNSFLFLINEKNVKKLVGKCEIIAFTKHFIAFLGFLKHSCVAVLVRILITGSYWI